MPSSRRVRLTEEADSDFTDIAAYTLEQWGFGQMETYASTIRERLDELGLFPFLGPSRHDLAAGLRGRPVGEHIVFYVVTNEEVIVRRILHSRSNLKAELRKLS